MRRNPLLHNDYCILSMRVTGVSMTRISQGRRIAFEALAAIEHGAYASDCLRAMAAPLDSRNAGLAHQIVFGCLRFQGQLDFLIFHYSGRHAADLDAEVRLALRMGIFQLRFLDRVPAHAAVHETVELVKQRRRAAAGFANAVLRKVNRDPVRWPDEATELSLPGWMLERWRAHFGEERARAIARAGLEEPRKYVRVGGEARLAEPAVETSTHARRRTTEHEKAQERRINNIRELFQGSLDAAGKSACATNAAVKRLQDIGSQSIVPLLDLRAGQSYLDLCAAPGNKTLQALEQPLALAVACDVSEKRLREIPAICPRVVLDATQPLPFSRRFDRILVDAPCSGTGTLGRNPEIKWRVEPEDFVRFGEKQGRILDQALRVLSPEGKLVYATCSLEPEENEEVVKGALGRNPELRLERTEWRVPGTDEGDGFFSAVFSMIRSNFSCGASQE